MAFSVPDNGYSKKSVVRTKFDTLVFIYIFSLRAFQIMYSMFIMHSVNAVITSWIQYMCSCALCLVNPVLLCYHVGLFTSWCTHKPVLSSFITGFETRVTRWVSHVDQVLLILLKHLRSLLKFDRVHVARSLVFCVVFCRS